MHSLCPRDRANKPITNSTGPWNDFMVHGVNNPLIAVRAQHSLKEVDVYISLLLLEECGRLMICSLYAPIVVS
jgi:hypothetical protein